ncbi:hypothetical protein [Leptospira interrogans]|uniref:hypothetical protein n=1 Tax=Leptospira interrogans TaxID=173 RepID=UPI0017815DEA|nr:hypothetical protein [Leptospira interrogans]
MRWPIWIHLRNGVLQSPKRAINLPPAFLTPSIQEYHTSTCLTSKNHTNLRIAFETQQNALSYGSRSRLKLKAKYHITFLSYNLLTKTENAAGFIQAFLL